MPQPHVPGVDQTAVESRAEGAAPELRASDEAHSTDLSHSSLAPVCGTIGIVSKESQAFTKECGGPSAERPPAPRPASGTRPPTGPPRGIPGGCELLLGAPGRSG